MRSNISMSEVIASALLLAAPLSVSLAGPDSATNPTSRQPDDANTPTQASHNTDDNQVTQQIRTAVMADGSISADAKKVVDIRTNADAVVLRGAVSADEKDRIEHIASEYAGTRTVTSELTIRQI